jgi:hypothetical protein
VDSVLGTHSCGLSLQTIQASRVDTLHSTLLGSGRLEAPRSACLDDITASPVYINGSLQQQQLREHLRPSYLQSPPTLLRHPTSIQLTNMKSSTTLAFLLSLTTTTASVLNFWANANCDGGLEIEAVDLPSEAGCLLLNLRGGTSALSAKAPNEIPSDCAIELYKDASCNTLEAVFDWGIDQGGKFWTLR